MAGIRMKGLSYDSMARSASAQFSLFDKNRSVMVSMVFDHERVENVTGEQADDAIKDEVRQILAGCLGALGPPSE